MSKAATDLIERAERETGQRIDDNDYDNNAMALLFGALLREMGKSPSSYKEQDDMVAGLVFKHQQTQEYQKEQESKKLMADLLSTGISPDTLKDIME